MMWKPFTKEGSEEVTKAERQMLEDAARQHPLFERLDPSQITALGPALTVKEFQDEEIDCHCPDAFHDAFILLEGVVSVTREREDALHVVQLEEAGALFNVCPLVGLGACLTGARALGPVRVLSMDNARLLRLFDQDPALGYAFLGNVCRLLIEQHDRQLVRLLD